MTAIDYAHIEAERDRIRAEHLREQRPASSARGVHHVALLCSDVERTVRFYQDLLEFPLTEIFENRDYRGSNHFFFDIGNGNLLAFFDLPGLDLGPYAEVLGGPAPHRHLGRAASAGSTCAASSTPPGWSTCWRARSPSTSATPTAPGSSCSPTRSARCTA